MKKYFSFYRLATYVLFLFAVGHTTGIISQKSKGTMGDAVLMSMKGVHFEFMGEDCTFYGFYFGFGMMLTVFLLFSATLTWWLGGLDQQTLKKALPIRWTLFVSFIFMTILSGMYFFIGPVITSSLITLLLGVSLKRDSV
jgi:hypothetical protein